MTHSKCPLPNEAPSHSITTVSLDPTPVSAGVQPVDKRFFRRVQGCDDVTSQMPQGEPVGQW